MIRELLRRQTLASFDYQWRELPEGEALLSDDWFLEHVDAIISEELLCLRKDWFRGRAVLDAGAGNGRWTVGLLKLGCNVVAVDFSSHALERVRENVVRCCSEAESARLETLPVDLLAPPAELLQGRFDLVFSFGVLHHTGDTHAALRNVAQLVDKEGALFLYLYGRESLSRPSRTLLAAERLVLAPLPFGLKRRVIRVVRPRSDVHQVFDAVSPTINTRHTFDEVDGWLRRLGFEDVERTIPTTELFIRALHARQRFNPYLLPTPDPPYWFERYAAAKPAAG
jgi:SAM-dependent methyltransferase